MEHAIGAPARIDPSVVAATRSGAAHLVADLARRLREGQTPAAALEGLSSHPRPAVASLARRLAGALGESASLSDAFAVVGNPFPPALSRAAEVEEASGQPGVLLGELAPTVDPPAAPTDMLTVFVCVFELAYYVQTFLWVVAGEGFRQVFMDIGADLPLSTTLTITVGELLVPLLPFMVTFSIGWRVVGLIGRERLPERFGQSLPAGARIARRRFCAALAGLRAMGATEDPGSAATRASEIVGPGLWTRGLERLDAGLESGMPLHEALAATRWFNLDGAGRLVSDGAGRGLQEVACGKDLRVVRSSAGVAFGVLAYIVLFQSVGFFFWSMIQPLIALVEMLG